MGKINVLPTSVAELIAAGEVIDRPASIVKELVENALDAGATRITVELRHGGITFLRVTDNGSGMTRDDVPLAFIRHATSKITCTDDLDSIGTLGFRGEALPSIAAVSHVKVITRTAESTLGCCYYIEASTPPVLEDIGCAVGTSIEVRDLFYNTPARMKFLKKDETEGNAIASLMDRLALANPQVALELFREGRRVLKTPGDGKLISAMRVVCGSEVASAMIPVSLKREGILVSGLISRPTISRSTRSLQTFFINSRYIRSKTCAGAVEEAYKNRLMVGRFPACVINLEVDCSLVDVNVHPAKLEVRFSDERTVYNAVYSACIDALSQNEHKPFEFAKKKITPFMLSDFDYSNRQVSLKQNDVSKDTSAVTSRAEQTSSGPAKTYSTSYSPPIATYSDQSDLLEFHDDTKVQLASTSEQGHVIPPYSGQNRCSKNFMIDIEKTDQEEKNVINAVASSMPQITPAQQFDAEPNGFASSVKTSEETETVQEAIPYRIIGELFDTYILVEQLERFVLIDKHAAHERFIYNSIKHLERSDDRQIFLTPQAVTLPRDEYFAFVEHPEALKTLGIIAEDFGEGTLLVRELPMILDGFSLIELLGEVAKTIISQKNSVTPQMLDELLYSVSCRAAIMAGKHSAMPEMEMIADLVLGNEQIRYCPHGRPVMTLFTKYEVEKLFGRMG